MIKRINTIKEKMILLILAFFAVCPILYAQTQNISGKVIDQKNEPLMGVTIMIKNSSNGTITDFDGNYTLNNVKANDVLVFSYMGYENKEVTAGNQKTISVTLSESSIALNELVVVGYGTQKKVNLTGAVSAINVGEELTSRSVASASTALQGLVPGLTVTQGSGMAGNDNSTLNIRGIGTINNSSPLIVVDDMPDVDINRINMDDIESISVLKDATAASVYGSRAANGVILIKTKSGKGQERTKISFSGSYAWQKPTQAYSYLSDYPRALMIHRASQATSQMNEANMQFKKGTIEQWLALGMIDGVRYPSTDWWDEVMQTGTLQNYNVSASGSNDKSNFYASIGYMGQEGMQINNEYKRYNARFNFDYKIFKNVNTGIRLDGNWSKFQYALSDGFTGDGNNDMTSAVAGIYPYDSYLDVYGGVMAYGEDPVAFNPYEFFTNRLKNKDRQELNGSFYLDWSPVKGLTARIDYALRYTNQFEKQANTPSRAYNFQTDDWGSRWYVNENAPISNRDETTYKTLLNMRLNYNINIAKNHDIGAMFVYSEEYWNGRNLSASRNDRLHPSMSEINAALTDVITNGGTSYSEGLRSYIGRLNYTAYDKYLLEMNFRVDGSSKFQPGHQYGFFPSIAVGWRFNEESFVKEYTRNWLSNGKLRASYGSLGNNSAVTRTEQQEVLFMSNYILDGNIDRGFVYRKMINPNLTWESTTVFNIGLDLGFFNGRLSAELDYYDRLTSDMIQQSKMSTLLTGAYEAPRANIGDMRNRGAEMNITWRDKIQDFNYSVNLNASVNKTKIEKWSEYVARGYAYDNKNVFLDMTYDYVYSYRDNGIIQSYADEYNYIFQGLAPGDIQRLDVNGDGRVDENDRIVHKGSQRHMPTTNFGMNINMSWKGFDLSMLFQGTAGRKDFWRNSLNRIIIPTQRYASSELHLSEPWSWENRTGAWPRLGGIATNETVSDFWLDDLSYLRMKNLMVGYRVPKKLLRVIGVDNLRIYTSMENLFTITSFRGLDPEKPGSDMYPMAKSYSIGVNIDF